MIRQLRLLKKLDLFGVPYKTQISLSEDEQKSLFGGLTAVTLYGLSFAYFIYVFVQWQSGNILPGFSSMIKAQSSSSYQFQKGELFQFTYYRYSESLLDPFDPQNIILLPLGYILINGDQGEAYNLIANSNETSRYNSTLLSPDKFQIQQNVHASVTPDEIPEKQYAVVFRQCDESFLTQGQKCASQELVQQFWSSGVNYVIFWFKLRQFNILTKDVDMIEKEILFPLSNFTNTVGQFLFQPVNLKVDDGILFRNEQIKKFINDFKVITSQTGMDFYQNILKYNTYISFFMRVDPIIHSNRVTYPKLDQILAEVGSIASSLLMIRVVITLINQKILEERLLKRIIGIYHPFIKYNQKEPLQLMDKIKTQAKKKLIITDIIEEIYDVKKFIEQRYGQNAIKDVRKQKHYDSESSLFVRVSPKTTFRQKSWG